MAQSGEGSGNPLQCSCLENPRDGGAWWAAVYGAAQSRTRLKRLSRSSGSEGEVSTCNVRDLGLIPKSGSCSGKGNGILLQYSCLENPRDGGARWAAVYGAAQSRTRLKRLSSSNSKKICFIDCAKAFDCVDHNNLENSLKRWEYQTTLPAS